MYELLEGLKRFFEMPIWKGSFSGISWVVLQIFGLPNGPMKAFVFLLFADLITGIYKAWKTRTLKSFISHEKGRKKYITYALILFLAHFLDMAGYGGVRDIALLWSCWTEYISITENLKMVGVNLPIPFASRLDLENKKLGFKDGDSK